MRVVQVCPLPAELRQWRHRVARAVADAGHESLVYAGHLDESREPLSTWTDEDDGVTVRWVTTTPWSG